MSALDLDNRDSAILGLLHESVDVATTLLTVAACHVSAPTVQNALRDDARRLLVAVREAWGAWEAPDDSED